MKFIAEFPTPIPLGFRDPGIGDYLQNTRVSIVRAKPNDNLSGDYLITVDNRQWPAVCPIGSEAILRSAITHYSTFMMSGDRITRAAIDIGGPTDATETRCGVVIKPIFPLRGNMAYASLKKPVIARILGAAHNRSDVVRIQINGVIRSMTFAEVDVLRLIDFADVSDQCVITKDGIIGIVSNPDNSVQLKDLAENVYV